MSTKQVMIFIDEGDTERLQKAEASVSRILAIYPCSIIGEVDEAQVKQLTSEGFHLESLTGKETIKLRSIEFDPTVEVPVAPAALSLRAEEVGPTEENYWIVQFVGPVKSEWGESVRELGGNIGDYVPDNAFLVRMTPGVKDQVSQLDFVRWVGPYQPAYKISPPTLRNAEIKIEAYKPTSMGNIRVVVHKTDDMAAVRQEVERLGGTIISAEKEFLLISLDTVHIKELAGLPSVQWIEPYARPKLFNDVAAGIIGVQPVWNNHGLDGRGQIVAVADTGLDKGVNDTTMHDDFRGRIVFIHNRRGDAADRRTGHGTHVAGSVLGNGSRSNGDIRGIAFNAQLVFQAAGDDLAGIPDDLNALFQQSYNDGARIFSNSWGSTGDWPDSIYSQYTSHSRAVDNFIWNHKDAIILFAAGNEGRVSNPIDGVIDPDSLCVEATAKNCITVGASENNRPHGSVPAPGYDISYGTGWWADFMVPPISTDHVSNNPDGMAAFSSRGPTDDGRIKPDVVAPGTNILSIRSSVAAGTGWGLLPEGDARRDFYMFNGGTSMATPITAGTAALVRQYLQNACLLNPSAALIKAMLIHGAVPMAGQYETPEVGTVPNNDEGWGRINLDQTLFPTYPTKLEFRDSAADAVSTGELRNYTFSVINTSVPFRVTLVWTDYPSTLAAGGLVNELRLSVIAPDGTVTKGAPKNNNVQQVVITTPKAGTYTIRVTGINVPTATMFLVNEKQDFALVTSGGFEFVDVYIKDNPEDNGVPPARGVVCSSPDIWVSLSNDPLAPPTSNPEYGQTNYVFVRVHNRGSKMAILAEVKLYWANPGTNLSKPYWKTAGIKAHGLDGYNRTFINVPAHGALGDGEEITQAFEWVPPDPKENTVDEGHFCLFATVSHREDPILQEDVDRVQWEDNLAWKNEIVKDAVSDSTTSAEFYVAGISGNSVGALYIDSSSAPVGGEIILKIPVRYLDGASASGLNKVWESEGGLVCRVALPTGNTASLTGIKLKSRENTQVRIEVQLPASARAGDTYPVSVEQWVNGQTTGRVTLVARIKGTPAYIANRNPKSLEIHVPNCQWAKKISGHHKVPFDDLQLALKRGYNGCRFCLPEYNKE